MDFLNAEDDYYKNLIEYHGFKQNIEGVTRRFGNGGTCIDHIITNFHLLQKGILHKNISDHQVTMVIWNSKNEGNDYLSGWNNNWKETQSELLFIEYLSKMKKFLNDNHPFQPISNVDTNFYS